MLSFLKKNRWSILSVLLVAVITMSLVLTAGAPTNNYDEISRKFVEVVRNKDVHGFWDIAYTGDFEDPGALYPATLDYFEALDLNGCQEPEIDYRYTEKVDIPPYIMDVVEAREVVFSCYTRAGSNQDTRYDDQEWFWITVLQFDTGELKILPDFARLIPQYQFSDPVPLYDGYGFYLTLMQCEDRKAIGWGDKIFLGTLCSFRNDESFGYLEMNIWSGSSMLEPLSEGDVPDSVKWSGVEFVSSNYKDFYKNAPETIQKWFAVDKADFDANMPLVLAVAVSYERYDWKEYLAVVDYPQVSQNKQEAQIPMELAYSANSEDGMMSFTLNISTNEFYPGLEFWDDNFILETENGQWLKSINSSSAYEKLHPGEEMLFNLKYEIGDEIPKSLVYRDNHEDLVQTIWKSEK